MRIAGLQKASFVDYPGKIAAVVFTPGCNMNCFYCHNWQLISGSPRLDVYTNEQFLKLLGKRHGLLDAVVISGGEPTLQPDLEAFIARIREEGFAVKLDTNGSNPRMLKKLIDGGNLDYVAMDLKAPMRKYGEITGVPVELTRIRESIGLLLDGKVDYEFRTTVIPQLGEEDLIEMVQGIRGARRYFLQQYKPPTFPERQGDERCSVKPHPPSFIHHMVDKLGAYVDLCEARGLPL